MGFRGKRKGFRRETPPKRSPAMESRSDWRVSIQLSQGGKPNSGRYRIVQLLPPALFTSRLASMFSHRIRKLTRATRAVPRLRIIEFISRETVHHLTQL